MVQIVAVSNIIPGIGINTGLPCSRCVCALLSKTPAETCLIVVLMLYRVIWFEYRSSMFRVHISVVFF